MHPLLRRVMALPLHVATITVANSLTTASLIRQDTHLPTHRTILIRNGVAPPPRHAVTSLPRELPSPIRLLVVGRISPRKGTDVAVSALQELLSNGYDVVLDLVGDIAPGQDAFLSHLHQLCGNPSFHDRVNFCGYQNDVWEWYRNATVVLFPSRVESFGNVAVEAMLARRPIIASNIPGISEIIEHGESGLLVTPGSGTDLALAVRQLIADWRHGAQNMIEQGQRRSESFGPVTYNRNIAAAIATLITPAKETRERADVPSRAVKG